MLDESVERIQSWFWVCILYQINREAVGSNVKIRNQEGGWTVGEGLMSGKRV